MTFFQVAILAIVQGITEFVPVSSSGHLVLARRFLGWSDQGGLLIDTILHAGSLVAILVYYRKEWQHILAAYTPKKNDRVDVFYKRLPWLLIAATIPVALIAPFLKDFLESTVRSGRAVGVVMLLTAGWFFAAECKRKRLASQFTFSHALSMGLAQIVALLPGASRSGWTSGAGILTGHSRGNSVRFAFYMAIPAIAGALVFQVKDMVSGEIELPGAGCLMGGFVICFLASLASIHFCMRFFREHSLRVFGVYLAVLGVIAVIAG